MTIQWVARGSEASRSAAVARNGVTALWLFAAAMNACRTSEEASKSQAQSASPAPVSAPPRAPTTALRAGAPEATPSSGRVKANCVTAEALGAAPLTNPKPNGKEPTELERRAVKAAQRELRRLLEAPEDFYGVVQPSDALVLVELWHRTALGDCVDAESGNERNRTLVYDVKSDRIVSTRWNSGSP